jgi:hypothetical protein
MAKKQKFSRFSIMFVFVTALTLFHAPNVLAQTDYESFRQDLITFVDIYGNADSDATSLILDMSSDELEAYYFMLSNPSLFAQANEQAEARQALKQELQPQLQFEIFSHAASSGFPPDYPSGGNYDTYTASLPGLGIMLAGPTNRTDASAVGGAWIAYDVLEFLAITAQGVCDAALLVAPIACPLAAIANAAARATQIVLQQADYQDALIDGAEIEAAYENTVTIIGQGNDLNDDLATHDDNIDGDLIIHDANIDADLVQHDTDIKALLDNLQGAVDENQRLIKITMSRQQEIIRLLITPSGRRVINSDVLTCTGEDDDCPIYPALELCENGSLSWNCED